MIRSFSLAAFAIAIAAQLPIAAQAETITITNITQYNGNFNPPTGVLITGDSDVSDECTLLAAVNYGSVGSGVTTVNGVPFENVTSNNMDGQVASSNNQIRRAGNTQTITTTGANTGAFAGLSTEYQSLLGEGLRRVSFTPNSSLIFESDTLAIGREYQFQLWVNDSSQTFANGGTPAYNGSGVTTDFANRSFINVGSNTLVVAGNVLSNFQVAHNNDFANIGGLGSLVTGEFTYEGGPDVVLSTANVLNAVQLRDITPVPEPSTSLALLLTTSLVATRGSRRRS